MPLYSKSTLRGVKDVFKRHYECRYQSKLSSKLQTIIHISDPKNYGLETNIVCFLLFSNATPSHPTIGGGKVYLNGIGNVAFQINVSKNYGFYATARRFRFLNVTTFLHPPLGV